MGIENPLEVLVNKNNCKDFKLASADGNIQSTELPCYYTFQPSKTGKASIYVVNKANQKTIDTIRFKVADIPLPVATLANKNGGNIRRSELKVQMGIAARYEGFDFDAKAKILGFTIVILRGNAVTFSKVCDGALFQDGVKKSFGDLQNGDRVVFFGIQCVTADQKNRRLEAIEFSVVE
jgi:hypothetical protein